MANYEMRAGLEKRYVIREAIDHGDTYQVIEMARLFFDEAASDDLVFDQDEIIKYCVSVYEGERLSSNLWLLFCDNEPCGFMVAHSTTFLFSKQRTSTTEVLFAKADHRSFGSISAFMRKFSEWSDSISAVQQYTGVARTDGIGVERLEKVFPRFGFRKVGSLFVKEIRP